MLEIHKVGLLTLDLMTLNLLCETLIGQGEEVPFFLAPENFVHDGIVLRTCTIQPLRFFGYRTMSSFSKCFRHYGTEIGIFC